MSELLKELPPCVFMIEQPKTYSIDSDRIHTFYSCSFISHTSTKSIIQQTEIRNNVNQPQEFQYQYTGFYFVLGMKVLPLMLIFSLRHHLGRVIYQLPYFYYKPSVNSTTDIKYRPKLYFWIFFLTYENLINV